MGADDPVRHGYKVITAKFRPEGTDILSGHDPAVDLLITDLVMPVMSGRELMEHARKPSPAPASSARAAMPGPKSRRDPAYLQKPFTARIFVEGEAGAVICWV